MERFLAKQSAELGREIPILSDQEWETLEAYDWPGNIRELENLARKIVVLIPARRLMILAQNKAGTSAVSAAGKFFLEGRGTGSLAASRTGFDFESAGTHSLESKAIRAGLADQLQVAFVQDQTNRAG
jgi:transcriptional regulator with PAS, ATPase and Fis domain